MTLVLFKVFRQFIQLSRDLSLSFSCKKPDLKSNSLIFRLFPHIGFDALGL